MQCRNCNSLLSAGDHFCRNCGTPADRSTSFFHQREGTAPAVAKQPFFRKWSTLFIGTFAFVILFSAVFFFFGVLPRANHLSALKITHENLVDTSNKTGKVNQAVEAIYNYITAAARSTNESMVPQTSIHLVSTQITKPQLSLLLLESGVREATASMKNKNVKGFSTPTTDPLKAYRDLKDLSQNAQHSVADSKTALNNLTSTKTKTASAQLAASADITKVSNDTENYIVETERTAGYYSTYSESYIALSTAILDSLQATTAEQLKTDLSTAQKIQTSMKNIGNDSLPNEIDNFHQDVLEEIGGAVSFLDTFTTLAQSSDPSAADKAAAAAQKWVAQEKALASRIQIDEVSFWKNNEILGGFDFLSENQNAALKKLDAERKANQLFLLSWLGIK